MSILFSNTNNMYQVLKKVYRCNITPILSISKQWVSLYKGQEVRIDDICQQFSNYEGGKVDLHKDEESGIAFVAVNNAERKNALSGKMMVDLWNIINELEEWKSGKGVILHSVGDIFCSGGDLTTVRQIFNHDDGYKMSTLMHSSLARLHQLPLVSVAVVQGKALGGGAELAIACDYRYFTEGGELSFVQSRMGVVTGFGGGTRLCQLVGHQTALDLLLTCSKVSSKEALRLGLANEILKSTTFPNTIEEAKQVLQLKLNYPPEIVRGFKRIISTAGIVPYEDALRMERKVFAMLWGGEAQSKALNKNTKHK